MANFIPLDDTYVTGEWANSPAYYAQFGQLGHNGIDYGTYQVTGKPVHATAAGVVTFAGWGGNYPMAGAVAGNYVGIRHDNFQSGYAHLDSWVVQPGQTVAAGQLIAYSGNTSGAAGGSTAPHLHFETLPLYPNYSNGFAGRVNPTTYGPLVPRVPVPNPIIALASEEDMKIVKYTEGRKTRWFQVGGGLPSVEITEAQSNALKKIWGARRTVTKGAIESYDAAIRRGGNKTAPYRLS